MKELLTYMLETLAASGVLLGAYSVLLERQVPFRWCRAWLLVSMVLAALIPLLRIPVWAAEVVTVQPAVAVEAAVIGAAVEPDGFVFGPGQFVWALYGAGVCFMLGLLFWQRLVIRRLERGAEIEERGDYRLVRTLRPVASFSFFRTVYVSRELPAEELPAVLAHERSHIRHRHTLERVAMELLKVALWWNPFVWFASRRLTEVEEFEADADALGQGFDVPDYLRTIFRQQFGYCPEIANGLHDSLTKKRFKMMTAKSTSRHARLRLAAALPLVAVLVVAFGFTAKATVYRTLPPDGGATEIDGRKITVRGVVLQKPDDMPVAGARVVVGESFAQIADRMKERGADDADAVTDAEGRFTVEGPASGQIVVSNREGSNAMSVFYACETGEELMLTIRLEAPSAEPEPDAAHPEEDNEPYLVAERMPEFEGGNIQNFRQWVMMQVRYPAEALQKKIQGRVIVQFVVERDGSLRGFKVLQTPDRLLSEEVIRILAKAPKWTPGRQNGKLVRVEYTLPVDFRLPESLDSSSASPVSGANTVDEVTVVGFGA